MTLHDNVCKMQTTICDVNTSSINLFYIHAFYQNFNYFRPTDIFFNIYFVPEVTYKTITFQHPSNL